MKTFFFLLLVAAATVQPSFAGDDAFEKDIKKFMQLNGSKKTYEAAVVQMLANMRTNEAYLTVPQLFWDEMEKEMLSKSVDDLFDLLADVYKKHFTHDEIKAFIAFYESPAGKKLAQKSPEITTESMEIGQQWGMQIGMKIGNKLVEEGY